MKALPPNVSVPSLPCCVGRVLPRRYMEGRGIAGTTGMWVRTGARWRSECQLRRGLAAPRQRSAHP